MSGNNQDHPECEGIRQYKQTAREIVDIRKAIGDICANSKVNKISLKHLTDSFKELATANSLTHYKLFARTETAAIEHGKLETAYNEHVKYTSDDAVKGRHKNTMLVSYFAIAISIGTMVVLAIQAGVFK